jgi:hypothetical protein
LFPISILINILGRPANDFKEYQLQQGQLAAERERFVPWQAIKKYPYSFIGRANRELVSISKY